MFLAAGVGIGLLVLDARGEDPGADMRQAVAARAANPNSPLESATPGLPAVAVAQSGRRPAASTDADLGDAVVAKHAGTVPGEVFVQALDLAARTYLTSEPDITRLHELLRQCAERVTIDEATVRKDDQGVVTGELRDPASGIGGSFELDGDRYRVTLDDATSGDLAATSLQMRQITIQAHEELGSLVGASFGVQFHPDLQPGASVLQAGELERIIGWNVGVTQSGTKASALTVRRDPDGRRWQIGRTSNISVREEPGSFDPRAFDAWMRRLRAATPQAH
ncbi:MAG: hypothetical protein ACKVWV_18560 [Planctomycetota bacterium]